MKKKFISSTFLVFILAVFTANSQENLQRKQLFDYDWRFYLGDTLASSMDFNDKNWRKLDLPHDWSIEGKMDINQPMGNDGGYFPAGKAWYRKEFTASNAWQGKKLTIYFEGVYMNSEVFINGKSLGIHPYGYTSFDYDLTPYLNYGKKNVIAVKVDNSQQKNCRWYSGSGIYRHVWLIATDKTHIKHWGVFVTTPEVSKNKATVQVKTVLKNETSANQNVVLSTQLLDKKSKKVGNTDLKVEIPANSEKEVVQTITINNPALWTPEIPNLYQAQLNVLQGTKTLDTYSMTFGVRSLQFNAENGFLLNGESVKINGGCVHHDNGCLGAVAYDRAEERRIELLKAGGFNTVRTSHNPPSEAFLEACDRLGLMVIDEAFDGWREKKNDHDYSTIFDDWSQRDLESMVRRDRNHPSIIMWSIGNEIIERKKPEAVETAKRLAKIVKQNDTSRPVTSAMTTWDKDWEIFDSLMAAHDVCGYNYELHRANKDHQRVPSRIMLQTESYPRDAFANWNLVQNNKYVIGDVVWTAMDYLGESGIGRYFYPGEPAGQHWEKKFFPWHGGYCGDIDLTGWRKPISHYRSMLYNNTEKLYMAVREPHPTSGKIQETKWSVFPTWESWTWNGFEGKEVEVEIYSKYPKVRLYLNDKLIGEKETSVKQEFKATFSVTYTAGTLKAVGVENDKEKESTILKTAGKASKIKLNADHTKIVANAQDLSFVTIEIVDKDGTIQPDATNELKFKIQGEGVIVGVDNASLKEADSYVADTRKAWHGRALVVVKSTQKSGTIQLTVSAEGLKEETITIKTTK